MLKSSNWNKEVKERLTQLVTENKQADKYVVFDFDNTIICHDIADRVLELLATDNLINKNNIDYISPAFELGDKTISLQTHSVMAYYEYMHQITHHQNDIFTPNVNAYVWAAHIMSGLPLNQLIQYSDQGFLPAQNSFYKTPKVYPEMIELIVFLLENKLKVYFISASNVWTIRRAIQQQLNPKIYHASKGEHQIPLDNVFGISVLLKNRLNGKMYKDELLARNSKQYLNFEINEIKKYELSGLLNYPVTSYHGKVAAIQKFISTNPPLLVAGDSMNDLPMMQWADNVLFITKHSNSQQNKFVKQISEKFKNSWCFQQVDNINHESFVS